MNLEKLLRESLYVHKEITINEEDGAENRWKNRTVKDALTLFDASTLPNFVANIDANAKIMVDEVLGKVLRLDLSTDVEFKKTRPWPKVTIKLDHLDLSTYTHLYFKIYIKAEGYQNFYYQFSMKNKDHYEHHSPSLTPNMWNEVMFQISDLERDDVTEITIGPWLMGTPPEGLPEYFVSLSKIEARLTDVDDVIGWGLKDRIAYSNTGYLPNAIKYALTSIYKEDSFSLLDKDHVIYEKKVQKIETKLGSFILLDFSDYKTPSTVKLKYGDTVTPSFEISDQCFDTSIWMSMNFLRSLRCGCNVLGVHSKCHLNSKTLNLNTKTTVPNFGGWHDAGDLSQFEIPTAEMTHGIAELALSIKEKDVMLYERLKEEARVGADWLLQTRFEDGSRALAVTYNYYRHNEIPDEFENVKKNISENGPFENLLAACALAKASILFEEDAIYSNWCLRTAVLDFNAALDGLDKGYYSRRWGPTIESQTYGTLALAAVEIYRKTKEKKYLDLAQNACEIVMSCQEKEYIGDEIKLRVRGFFYEDRNHKYILTYEHRGHEQSPIQGIAELLLESPDIEIAEKLKNCLELYGEYVKTTMQFTYPYNLLPGHVYILDKINKDRFTIPSNYGTIDEGLEILKNQAREGIKITKDTYLRIFPIAVQRRGFHATLLSKTKAVTEIYKITKEESLRQIAINQIEWILGKNPFASSTMYGFGYNYHPLYVAFSRQMVGALPVGIMTKDNLDLPYWPERNHAVYKEVWGHTTGKYLAVLADLLAK